MLLQVRDLKTYFHTKTGPARAVDGVSFDIEAGETFCLVGESGCGKSLTALSIMQLVPQPPGYYAGGALVYKGRDLMRLPEAEKRRLRGREIAMIFQEPMTSLNPVLTVGYQLMEPLRHHQRLSESAARAKALDLLAQVYIPDPEQRFAAYPHQLSGGMKQRVMIAMALACEPGLLIADEPTTAVDVTVQAEILTLMKTLQAQKGTAILLITHDLGIVAEVADRVADHVCRPHCGIEPPETTSSTTPPTRIPSSCCSLSRPASDATKPCIPLRGASLPADALPPGCRFAPRCHMVQAACWQVDPGLLSHRHRSYRGLYSL